MSQTALTTPPRAARLRRDQMQGEYERQGYAIIPELLDRDLVEASRAESLAICQGTASSSRSGR